MTTLLRTGMLEPGIATTAQIAGIGDIFVGVEEDFPFVPSDPWWVPMYGQLLLVADYPVLAAKIGTTFGGDGVTNFRLPDRRGRVVAGLDNMGGTSANRLTNQTGGLNGDVLSATGGAETQTLALTQIPSHKHDVSLAPAGAHDHTLPRAGSQTASGAVAGSVPSGTLTTSSAPDHNHTVTEASKGGGQAHNNVQPTGMACKCILAYWPV